MRIQLSDHFTYNRLLRFVLPSIFMNICVSMYSIVDGFFVSNFVGKTSFAAVNLVMPVLIGLGSVGFMIGTGGSAIVSKTLGEGESQKANEYFSMLIYLSIGLGIILAISGVVFARPISVALGASGKMLEDCVIYSRILFAALPAFILQYAFQSFFIAAEKPNLSLIITITAGLTNMILDFLFIAVFQWGIAGAAFASALGQVVGGMIPVIYFIRNNDSLLKLTKCHFYSNIIIKTFSNGSSEMVTNLSASLVNILYNFQLMNLVGEDGIAAYGIIMYVNFIFMAAFIGYAIGSAPIVSYHYGAQNTDELKNMFRKGLFIMSFSGIMMTLLAELFSVPLVNLFASYDTQLAELTIRGFQIYSLAFVFMGINVWASAFFTSLNNGIVSAIISFLRTLVFQILAVLTLPPLLEIDGIWLAIVVAELLSLIVSCIFFITQRKRYQYI